MTADPPALDNITHWTPAGSCESLCLLRLDQLHPVVSGNKWFKLRPNLEAARDAGFKKLLSFGGGYSNHLVALAFAAREAGFGALGLVRGRYSILTPSLEACRIFGMELEFLHSAAFSESKDGASAALARRYPEYFIIPEGGANAPGVSGASRIARHIPKETTNVCVAVGTGTTLAGLELALPDAVTLHGYCAAKECDAARSILGRGRFPHRIRFEQVTDPRFGRWKPELVRFMQDFFTSTGIRLDVVYTGKMMQAVAAQLQLGVFVGKHIVCIHTGGLQGNPAGIF
jgi:1-aminocyclopropane-1-carboxylate deaminase